MIFLVFLLVDFSAEFGLRFLSTFECEWSVPVVQTVSVATYMATLSARAQDLTPMVMDVRWFW